MPPSLKDEFQDRLSDSELLDLVQKQTLKYFWDFAHPDSGMIRERSNPVPEYDYKTTVTTGGTGFGVMALIVGAERGWLAHRAVRDRVEKVVSFLEATDKYHGVFPHHLNGKTGKTVPFSIQADNGSDIVETAFLMMGLLTARQYFSGDNNKEKDLGRRINALWQGVEWNWHTKGGENTLYWHWSPDHGWGMNHPVRGWDETLVSLILATGSPSYGIPASVYNESWTTGAHYNNGKTINGIKLPLGPPGGGPLFFSHYSFLGLNPKGLKDKHADYFIQNRTHTLVNRAHCIANPHGYKGYGPACWGLTASDGDQGYSAHSPSNDRGVIAPTAALSAFPYTPKESMQVLRHLYEDRGDKLWGPYGFYDAFNETENWYADNYIAIDQGPIVVMIENYRSGLLWDLFMSCPEVKKGLERLKFQSPYFGNKNAPIPPNLD